MSKFIFQKKNGSTWYVRLAVPMDVQKALGRKVFVQSLKTTSRMEALHASNAPLAEWRMLISSVRKGKTPPDNWRDNVAAAATGLADFVQSRKRRLIGEATPPLDVSDDEVEEFSRKNPQLTKFVTQMVDGAAPNDINAQIAIQNNMDALFKVMLDRAIASKYNLTPTETADMVNIIDNPRAYKKPSSITSKRLTEFRKYRETNGIAAKTIDQQESKLSKLAAHLKEHQKPLSTDSVASWLNSLSVTSKTQAQYLLAGSVFWKWANRYDPDWAAEYKDRASPFENHDLPKIRGKAKAQARRKDFTLAELKRIYDAAVVDGQGTLAILIKIAAFTGARIEELCQLKDENVITVEGVAFLDITDSKTSAGIRMVPIHPSIQKTIDCLVAETDDGYLIKSKSKNKYGLRSDPYSKSFGRLKTSLQFGPAHVFHSIRATVITQLQRADISGPVIAQLVGHETGTVTFDVYSKGASPKQKLEAISKLPDFESVTG